MSRRRAPGDSAGGSASLPLGTVMLIVAGILLLPLMVLLGRGKPFGRDCTSHESAGVIAAR